MGDFTWDTTLRLIQVIVAIFALVLAFRTLRQKRESDDRQAWWSRLEWALDKISSEDNLEQAMGNTLLEPIIKSIKKRKGDEYIAAEVNALVTNLQRADFPEYDWQDWERISWQEEDDEVESEGKEGG